MAQKKVVLTWVGSSEEDSRFQAIGQNLASNGLAVSGSPWMDDLEHMAWVQLAAKLKDPESCDAWVLALEQKLWSKPSVRYGIAALNAVLRQERQLSLPIFFLPLDFELESSTMPTLLQNSQLLVWTETEWGAKVVAKLYRSVKPAPAAYRFGLRANTAFGQWFEVGPVGELWQGVMFGVSEQAKSSHHAVGPMGVLPDKTILEYPTQGIEAQIGETKFLACSVQNKLSENDSYFVKVEGFPTQVIFGGHAGTDQQEVFVIKMS